MVGLRLERVMVTDPGDWGKAAEKLGDWGKPGGGSKLTLTIDADWGPGYAAMGSSERPCPARLR